MSKSNIILLCCIIALIFLGLGFFLGLHFQNNFGSNKLVGTYRTTTWNGKEGILVLNKDKTMISPNGNGTWYSKDNKVYIEYQSSHMSLADDGVTLVTIYDTITDEIIVVDNGLMYKDNFFERVK